MAKARVFISHSTVDKPETIDEHRAAEVLGSLTSALESAGFLVQVDRRALQPGLGWRSIINAWLGCCDAAVVLLSDRALESAFVAYEVSVLSYRRQVDEHFRLIPVHLTPADRVRASARLAPAQIAEIQAVNGRDVDPVQEVISLLGGANRERGSSTARPVEQLRDLLLLSFPSDVQRAAQVLGVDLDAWHSELDTHAMLAAKMIATGIEGCIPALQHVSAKWERADLEEALQLIACGWIDARAAGRIPQIASAGGALESNAHDPLTAQLYVMRASPFRPRKTWTLVPVDGVVGELGRDAVRSEMMRKVRTAVGYALKTQDREILTRRLRAKRKEGQLVFVTLSRHTVDRALFAELRADLPEVTFFLLDGSPTARDLRFEAADEYILPELGEGEEHSYLSTYREKWDLLLES